jgi:hypothetical protein
MVFGEHLFDAEADALDLLVELGPRAVGGGGDRGDSLDSRGGGGVDRVGSGVHQQGS